MLIRDTQQALLFGAEDPIAYTEIDGAAEDPTSDLGVPDEVDDPGDVVDYDFDPIALSGRTGSVTNHLLRDDLRPTFGLESDFYGGFGPAVVVGCDMGCPVPSAVKG